MLHGLREPIRTLVDIKRESLLALRLVVDIKLVSKALTRNILAKRDNFLLNFHDVSDIDLPFLVSFSRF